MKSTVPPADTRTDPGIARPADPIGDTPVGPQAVAPVVVALNPVRGQLGAVLGRTDLSGVFDADAVLVGVTVEPGTGETFVLDATRGLYRLRSGPSVELVFDVRDAPLLESPFTDVAALGNGRFALTVTNDGYLLDVDGGTLTQHFCYLPDTPPGQPPQSVSDQLARDGIQVLQRTQSLAFSPELGLIYAQPQTIDAMSGAVLGSEIVAFDAATGDDLNWRELPSDLVAGGMIALGTNIVLGLPEEFLLLGNETSGTLGSPAGFGISRLDGMTLSSRGTLIVLDGWARALVEINGR